MLRSSSHVRSKTLRWLRFNTNRSKLNKFVLCCALSSRNNKMATSEADSDSDFPYRIEGWLNVWGKCQKQVDSRLSLNQCDSLICHVLKWAETDAPQFLIPVSTGLFLPWLVIKLPEPSLVKFTFIVTCCCLLFISYISRLVLQYSTHLYTAKYRTTITTDYWYQWLYQYMNYKVILVT